MENNNRFLVNKLIPSRATGGPIDKWFSIDVEPEPNIDKWFSFNVEPEPHKHRLILTSTFDSSRTRFMNNLKFTINTLAETITAQKRTTEYNEQYIAFLTNQLSEDEFEDIINKYTYEQKDIDLSTIADKIGIILGFTGLDYTPSEFADIFQCSVENVIQAIESIKKMNT